MSVNLRYAFDAHDNSRFRPQMSVEPTISFNQIDTPHGAFQTNLAVTRLDYAFSPRV